MLALVLIYFAGKQFAELAFEHEKSRWLYAILGILSYYVGIILTGLLIGVLIGLNNSGINDSNELAVTLICIPFGVLSCWGFYKFLKYKWSNTYKPKEN